MSTDDKNERFEAAVTAMTLPENRYDVTIICTTDDYQAEFWMSKLGKNASGSSGSDDDNFPMVLAVSEDWAGGGAGNGLGTLYAWTKAVKYAQEKFQVDLSALLADSKISASLYHTAGKGTRLAPLPASENNNKPGVKLPFLSPSTGEALTVLEAVVQQTGIYAPSRKGRLSVFWGDQVFLPSVEFKYTPTHHIDIMCTLLGDSAPTAEEWTAQGLEKYGVIAVLKGQEDGSIAEAAQVEKVDHATATKMLGQLGTIGQVGPSLGSFSVSAAILNALLEEFSSELSEKKAKFDTDPDFWMPLTLSETDYLYLMKQKGKEESDSQAHYQRMKKFHEKFNKGTLGLFGAVDVGKDACWWDYGQLKLYSKNSLLLLDDANPESVLLRKFLSLENGPSSGTDVGVSMDHSYAFASKLQSGTVKDSLVCQVTTKEMNADGSIIVNCVAPKITAGKGCILYNLMSENDITADEGQVMVAVTDEAGDSFVLKSRMDIDGGKAWKIAVEGNEFSFEQVHANNKEAKITKIAEGRALKYQKLAETL